MKLLLTWLTVRNLRLGLVAAPWLLAAVYMALLAADRYVAESVIAVRENGDVPVPGVDALSSLFGASAQASREDELIPCSACRAVPGKRRSSPTTAIAWKSSSMTNPGC